MEPNKIAFLLLTEDMDRGLPGLIMAERLKTNRGIDVRLLFFGPGVKLAASGQVSEQLTALREAGIATRACVGNVEQFGLKSEAEREGLELVHAGADIKDFNSDGFTVLSF